MNDAITAALRTAAHTHDSAAAFAAGQLAAAHLVGEQSARSLLDAATASLVYADGGVWASYESGVDSGWAEAH